MDAEEAKELLRRQRHCVLATSSLEGVPWVTPLFFSYDQSYCFFWESSPDARHSLLLLENPRAAIVVFDEEQQSGLYFDCTAQEVEAAGLAYALEIFKNGPHRKPDHRDRTLADYREDRPLRLYTAKPQAAFALCTGQIDGYRLDYRIPLDLPPQA